MLPTNQDKSWIIHIELRIIVELLKDNLKIKVIYKQDNKKLQY